MKQRTYRILSNLLAVICGLSLIMTCCEYADGSIGLWNFAWLAIFATSARFLDKVASKIK